MRPGLLGLLLLFAGQLALVAAASLTCDETDLKDNGAMCYFRFQCPELFETVCTRYALSGGTGFILYFPACCLFERVYRMNRKICHNTKRYAKNDICDPKEHTILKVENRPTTTTAAPIRIHNGGSSGGIPSGSSSVSSSQLRACPIMVQSSRYIQRFPYCCQHPVVYKRFKKACACPIMVRSSRDIQRFPYCCQHPVVYKRFKKACAFMRHYKRRKRNAEFLSKAWDADDEDPEDPDDLPPGMSNVPDGNMRNEEIEVKCCGAGGSEIKKCKGAECFYVCDGLSGDDIVDTIDVTSSDDLCNPEITGEATGGGKKRSAWSAATMASWKVNWCPRKVTADHGWWIRWYKICCFHPAVLKHPMNKNAKQEWKKKEGGVANYCHEKSGGLFSKWEDD